MENIVPKKRFCILNELRHTFALKRYPHFLMEEVSNVLKQNKIRIKFKLNLWVITSHSRAYIKIALITVIKSCLGVLKILAERISRSVVRRNTRFLCAKILY